MIAKVRLKKLSKLLPETTAERSNSSFVMLALTASNLLVLFMMFWLAASVSELPTGKRPRSFSRSAGRRLSPSRLTMTTATHRFCKM